MGFIGSIAQVASGPRMVIGAMVMASFVALAVGIWYIYVHRAGAKFVPNAQFIGDDDTSGAGPGGVGAVRVTMYGVGWCPHSKAARKPWNEWKEANDGKRIQGVMIRCDTVDCEADDESEARCHRAGVKGYPTVIAETPNGDSVIMEAKTTVAALNQFVAKVASSVATGQPVSG